MEPPPPPPPVSPRVSAGPSGSEASETPEECALDPPLDAASASFDSNDISETQSKSNQDENFDSGVCVEQLEDKNSEESPIPMEINLNGPSTSCRRLLMLPYSRTGRQQPNRSSESRWPSSLGQDDSDDDAEMDTGNDSRGRSPDRNYTSDDSDDDEDRDNDPEMSSSMDDSVYNFSDESYTHNEENFENCETPAILLKRKPNHTWNVVKELANREMGFLLKPGRTGKSDVLFEQRFYGSLHAVERLELMYKLKKHKGCVNSINFHPEGHLLASGSDDLNIVIWDWSTNTVRHVIKTNHKSNIFQSRFLYLNSSSQLNIVSCARDGQVRLTELPSSGGPPIKRLLAEHTRSAHKLYTNAAEPHIVVSAGEDAQVILSDVREEKPNKLLVVQNERVKVSLYSVAGHPLDIHTMCVAGRSRHVMIYDRRKAGPKAQPVQKFCPEFFRDTLVGKKNSKVVKRNRLTMPAYVTCAVYNHNGSEILASYNDDDIYLFDTVADCYTSNNGHGFTYLYSGHRNSDTFKGVSFFGPQSEYVVSGSDCANIYIWEKKTQTIVQWMMGDENGVVNCIECHPRFPVLATSGLDKDVKIWVPSNESDPTLTGLKETVIKNSQDRLRRPLFPRFHPRIYRLFEAEGDGTGSDTSDSNSGPEERLDINTCRAF